MNKSKMKEENDFSIVDKIIQTESENTGLSTKEVIYELKKQGSKIAKSYVYKIGSDNSSDTNYGYKTLIPFAKYFNISMDYLTGLKEERISLHSDIKIREMCDYLGYNEKTIQTLLFWSKGDETKNEEIINLEKNVIADLIQNINQDLVDAIIGWYRNKFQIKMIKKAALKLYCTQHNLNGINSIEDLSAEDRTTLNGIIKSTIKNIDYNQDKEEKRFKELIKNMFFSSSFKSIEKELLNNYSSDPDLKDMYDFGVKLGEFDYYRRIDKDTSNDIYNELFNSDEFDESI